MTDFSRRLAALMAEPSRDDAQDPNRLARVERTRVEMMVQGAAVRTTLEREAEAVAALGERIAKRSIDRVVILGCGDSWFVGMAVRHAWETLTGWSVEPAQALDYAAYGAGAANERTLAIGLSAGGDTPAVMAALEAARARGAFAVGLSNTPASPVLECFDAGLRVHATRKGWPTQSSTAAVALLARLGAAVAEALCRSGAAALIRDLDRMPALMDETAAALDPELAAVAERLAPASLVLFTGLGPNFAAAAFGAAKVRELSPVHALAVPLEEMHHYRIPKRGDPLFIVATDPASRERALDTALVAEAVSARTVAILARPDPDIAARADQVLLVPEARPALTPLLSTIPLHLFAYHFAKARFALGLGDPGGVPDPRPV